MNKKIKLSIVIFFIIIVAIFFIKMSYKTIKTGNNKIKSKESVIDYILNISSYEATLEIIVNSNKTTNKYLLKQYYLEPNYSKQVIIKPENIENLEIVYKDNNLEIKNFNLGLSKIYQDYPYLSNNILWLTSFIKNYKEKCEIKEDGEEIILKQEIEGKDYEQILYINSKSGLPSKMEILDNNNKAKIYIEYKEIKLNSMQQNNIFAVITKDIKSEI